MELSKGLGNTVVAPQVATVKLYSQMVTINMKSIVGV
jgi:hypothetical protein